MPGTRIPQLSPAIGLDGTEQIELAVPTGDPVVPYVSRRTTVGAIAGTGGDPTGVTPGSYGDSTHVGAFTVDAFGRLTAASSVVIGSGGIGTVTDLSVVTANGFAGSVALSTTTPQITLSTTVTGLLLGNGTGVAAAPTTGSGAVVLANTPTLITPVLGVATGTSLQLSGLTASSAVATDASKNLVSVTNTGTGNNVLATSPTIVTATLTSPTMTAPVLGAATATTINKVTITQPATGSTLTIQEGFTLTVNGNAIVAGNNTGDQTITLTGDVTGTGTSTFIATIPAQTITYAKMQNIATASFIGRNTAGTGSPETLSATVATALLNAMVGDSGSGGTKGLVPAPAAGDAAAFKYLSADGTWAVPAGSGAGTVNNVAVATANGFAGTVADPTNNAIITVKTTITGILIGNGTAISAASTTGSGSVVLATSPTLVTPALGTPSAAVLTNATGLPVTGLVGLGTGIATFLATPTSANLASALTDETGTGLAVFNTSPTLVTPALGVATATSLNKVTITAPATAATLTLIDGTTLTGPASSGTAMTLGNIETVTGVKTFNDGKLLLAGSSSGTTTLKASAAASGTITFPAATDTLVGKATTDTLTNKTLTGNTAVNLISGSGTLTLNTTGTVTVPNATDTLMGKATTDTLTNKTFDTAGTGNSLSINGVAATANTGTGSVVRATSPALVTPDLGTPSAGVMTNVTGTAASLTAGTATVANGLKSATTTVVVSAATAPTSGQVLTATSSTAANWATPAGGGMTLLGTLTPASGDTTASLTGIAAGYREFYIELDNVANNFGTGTLTIALGSGSTSYGTAANIIAVGDSVLRVSGFIVVGNVSSAVAAGKMAQLAVLTSGGAVSSGTPAKTPTGTAAVATAVQFGWTAGDQFQTGTFRVYGVR